MQRPIAVLDSGVGGLTIVKELIKQLPNEDIVYFGDTLRAPYGSRAVEEVLRFTEEIVNYLLSYNPKLIVIACNTATAMALDHIRNELSIPVIGVIEPGARAAIAHTNTKYIGVIGTEGTIKSKAYDQALQRLQQDIQIVSQACPSFVPLVERGQYQSPQAYHIVYQEIAQLRSYPIDCLILGCTHYPFLADIITEVMGETVQLIHSAEETTIEVKKVLQGMQEANIQQNNSSEQVVASISTSHQSDVRYQLICSGDVALFQKIAEEWLGTIVNDRTFTFNNYIAMGPS